MATTWRDSCSMPPRHVCGFSVKNTTEFPLSVRATIELWNAEKELSEVKEIPAGESISFSEKTVEVDGCIQGSQLWDLEIFRGKFLVARAAAPYGVWSPAQGYEFIVAHRGGAFYLDQPGRAANTQSL
eukprot:TRINITY_DN1547_c0_g1_i1.p1 TRINITY_DN1547_c0_g1~~TRINITY_DN1547_c0_g1_i1.p1  ORF type:complete len:128 (+),score=14.18 TRINITY_DN1547_c0_g1_i1:30-413(+)